MSTDHEPFLGQFQTMNDASNPNTHDTFLKINSSFRRTPILNSKHFHQGIDRFGRKIDKFWLYCNDLYHTLLNMPRARFIALFFSVYICEYVAFALFYLAVPDYCIPGVTDFSGALWFSVQTSATIGYGGKLAPDPGCPGTNVLVMLQVISSALVNYCMMGVVFARFSAPYKRSETVRISSKAVVQRDRSGYMALCVQVANVRKHVLLQPEVDLILSIPEPSSQSSCLIRHLEIQDVRSSLANLKLGLPALITHVISPSSPLYTLSLDEMEARGMEVILFLDGIDAMTSNNMSARQYYAAPAIRLHERFVTLYMKSTQGGKRVGFDMRDFDTTVSLDVPMQAVHVTHLLGTYSNTAQRRKSFAVLAQEASAMNTEMRKDGGHPAGRTPAAVVAVNSPADSLAGRMGAHAAAHVLLQSPLTAAATMPLPAQPMPSLLELPVQAPQHAALELVEAILADPNASAALKQQAAALRGRPM